MQRTLILRLKSNSGRIKSKMSEPLERTSENCFKLVILNFTENIKNIINFS